MNTKTEFNKWFDSEVQRGLVDLKLAGSMPGASPDDIKRDILVAEGAIMRGEFRNPPLPKDSVIDATVDRILKYTRVEGY